MLQLLQEIGFTDEEIVQEIGRFYFISKEEEKIRLNEAATVLGISKPFPDPKWSVN